MEKLKCPVPVFIPLIVGVIAVSFSSIFVKLSDAPVSVQGMYRLLFTVLFMLPFSAKHVMEAKRITSRQCLLLFLSGLFLALHFLLWMGSLKLTTVASSTIILALQPVFVLIGAFFLFNEKTSPSLLAGMGVAICGAVFIGWGDIGISPENLLGDVLSLLGTLAVAVHMLIGQHLLRRIPSFFYSLSVFVSAISVFACYNLAAGIPMVGYAKQDWTIFFLLAIIPTVFGHVLFNWLMKYVSAKTISFNILGEPVGASILAYFMLNEHITIFQAAGGFLVCTGLYVFLKTNHVKDSSLSQSV
ncbi:DMT family transporter [Fictibacillus terranigra]|uniref:DMT family transporter n=1 Tax=Fictibacillus terranigra TaxID=3058424 RepID=A0ABT8ECF1_9BACL|nr:DMT family transporter [Fictibacillus sp. CENA-BCM004]MDN4075584.1 DMT family transporter [Fictibacillus sp. CENA-BCM004]